MAKWVLFCFGLNDGKKKFHREDARLVCYLFIRMFHLVKIFSKLKNHLKL